MTNKTLFEQFGVDTIDENYRNSKPSSIITILFGGNLSMSVMIFGWLAIGYGLDFWSAVSSVFVGTLFGSILVSFTGLLGFKSATNNSVTSGAFFGVRGRLIASAIGLLLCLQYIALTIWTGGDVLAATFSRLTGTNNSNIITILTKVHYDKYTYEDLCNADFVIVSYSFLDNQNFLKTWLPKISGQKTINQLS